MTEHRTHQGRAARPHSGSPRGGAPPPAPARGGTSSRAGSRSSPRSTATTGGGSRKEAGSGRSSTSRGSGRGAGRGPAAAAAAELDPYRQPSSADAATAAPRRRRSRRGRSAKSGAAAPAPSQPQLTSLPTNRAAYRETRQWLLDRHGPICAYCAKVGKPVEMTLDHVTPRRGQIAYDRRDNLVLACKTCNADKKDKPILAFLLARRERAATLLQYGEHLSPMLLDLASQIAGEAAVARVARLSDPDYPYAD